MITHTYTGSRMGYFRRILLSSSIFFNSTSFNSNLFNSFGAEPRFIIVYIYEFLHEPQAVTQHRLMRNWKFATRSFLSPGPAALYSSRQIFRRRTQPERIFHFNFISKLRVILADPAAAATASAGIFYIGTSSAFTADLGGETARVVGRKRNSFVGRVIPLRGSSQIHETRSGSPFRKYTTY